MTLTGCGHLPTWDDPEQVARVLLEASAARLGGLGVRLGRAHRRRRDERGDDDEHEGEAWTAMPSVSLGIGSPKTMMPPRMQETLAAVEVAAMTGTASPSWRPRAEA